MRAPAIAVSLTAALLLAGCSQGSLSDTSTALPSSSSSSTSTASTPQSIHQVETFRLRSYLMIDEVPSNRTVRFFQTASQRDTGFSEQQCEPGSWEDGKEYFWVTVWNRTGLVSYQQWPAYPVSQYGTIDHAIQIPGNDPPYLFWPGSTCLGDINAEFHAAKWQLPIIGRGDHVKDRVGAIDMIAMESVKVQSPTGQTTGLTSLVVGDGNLQPVSWRNKEGSFFGDVYAYEPNAWASREWFFHSYNTPTAHSYTAQHTERGMPGTYRWELKPTAPMDTSWEDVSMWVYRFQEKGLTALGFQQPFKLYDWTWES